MLTSQAIWIWEKAKALDCARRRVVKRGRQARSGCSGLDGGGVASALVGESGHSAGVNVGSSGDTGRWAVQCRLQTKRKLTMQLAGLGEIL